MTLSKIEKNPHMTTDQGYDTEFQTSKPHCWYLDRLFDEMKAFLSPLPGLISRDERWERPMVFRIMTILWSGTYSEGQW